MPDFAKIFETATGFQPYDYQCRLAGGDTGEPCKSRLIDIPTGMGKTAAVVAAWLWNRVILKRNDWPRRLVYVLPMRTLVEQTARNVEESLNALAKQYPENEDLQQLKTHAPVVLMGGKELDQAKREWHIHPERSAILIGTQDMLLSRVLNRGYGVGRARWPMEYGLLNTDCLWVFDEVQLMDVGLVTSAQLHAFRQCSGKTVHPVHCWWMSATLRPDWLKTIDTASFIVALEDQTVSSKEEDQRVDIWSNSKSVEVVSIPEEEDKNANSWAKRILHEHKAATGGEYGKITLVIANTVEKAVSLYGLLNKLIRKLSEQEPPAIELAHSRFRGMERENWSTRFLSRTACRSGVNRIIVATQVVEAGVDISAGLLITELAPWPSLIQRFGRVARYGESGRILIIDRKLSDDKKCRPYSYDELTAALEALQDLNDASLSGLLKHRKQIETDRPELLKRLFPYAPQHIITRRECDELFDTTPDLTGADLDISRFIREGEERDVMVFWRTVSEGEKKPDERIRPLHRELCPVPFLKAREWLFKKTATATGGVRAWVLDFQDDGWRRCASTDIYPGQVLFVDATAGGYSTASGWTGVKPGKKDPAIPTVNEVASNDRNRADDSNRRDDWSQTKFFKTIATHGYEVAEEVSKITESINASALPIRVFELAGILHDWGKSHLVFQEKITDRGDYTDRQDLAKAPTDAWKKGHGTPIRHELASALALIERIRRLYPNHPALCGPFAELMKAMDIPSDEQSEAPGDPTPLDRALGDLSETQFNLLFYLVGSHHGKVRGSLSATPADQKSETGDSGKIPICGIRDGDPLPTVQFFDSNGRLSIMPALTLHLDPAALGLSARYGPSWVERVQKLVEHYGPFTLAYFEALFRAADIRASKLDTQDPLLTGDAK